MRRVDVQRTEQRSPLRCRAKSLPRVFGFGDAPQSPKRAVGQQIAHGGGEGGRFGLNRHHAVDIGQSLCSGWRQHGGHAVPKRLDRLQLDPGARQQRHHRDCRAPIPRKQFGVGHVREQTDVPTAQGLDDRRRIRAHDRQPYRR
jgi:hypothetical protein